MKRSPKVISLEYLQKLVKKQEDKEEREKTKKIIGYVYDDVYDTELKLLQIVNKDI